MGQKGFDIVVVRKSGPLQSLNVKGWWLYLAVGVLVLILPCLGGLSWVLYRHNTALGDLLEDSRLLLLRAERLESLVQEQETRDILLSQSGYDERGVLDKPRSKTAAAAASASSASDPLALLDERREMTAMDAKAAQAALAGEPTTSERMSLRAIEQKVESGDLVVSFEIMNERDANDPAMGYMTVVARGTRQGKPWIEAWPPMRLTPMGRPQNYRRGTPFSVQRFRKVKARVAAVADKRFERLELVFYNRQGDLIMVKSEPVALGQTSRAPSGERDDG